MPENAHPVQKDSHVKQGLVENRNHHRSVLKVMSHTIFLQITKYSLKQPTSFTPELAVNQNSELFSFCEILKTNRSITSYLHLSGHNFGLKYKDYVTLTQGWSLKVGRLGCRMEETHG